jgi:glycosyltransferase involved in cell wall biosynthesis
MKTIIHICGDCKGGTEKYVSDLNKLFPQYIHTIISNVPFEITDINNIVLIHIHSVFFESNIHWQILSIIDQLQSAASKIHIPIYLTIHDYQWLFEGNAFYTIEDREKCVNYYNKMTETNKFTQVLFNKVDRIFIPTQRVFDNYYYFMKDALNIEIRNKIHIIPHCDIPIRLEQLYIPQILDDSTTNNNVKKSKIKIAYIGTFSEYKGGRLFLDLIYNLREWNGYQIEYHIFGKHTPSENDTALSDYVYFHGAYSDETIIENLYDTGIHIITALSTLEETYCYALSLLINSGLSIIYLNRGALRTRLNNEYPRMFSFEESSRDAIIKTANCAIEYVIANQGCRDIIHMPNKIMINEGYQKLYLSEQ